MVSTGPSPSEKIRARLSHPVIDADGHYIEVTPILEDYIKAAGGNGALQRLKRRRPHFQGWHQMTQKERRDHWASAPAWWFLTQHTLDRATASLPRLLYERMEELGLDFTVLFPSTSMGFNTLPDDDELRQACCRAFNMYVADTYREYADRMTPVATIPMVTPQEAIQELEYAVKVLKLKAAMLAGYAFRPVTWVNQELANSPYCNRLDVFGIDSEYDYDPVWAKCIELKVAPMSHSPSHGFGMHRSPSNYMYIHLGQLATSADALCKALFFGGVTRRFPALKWAFMECGVGWACALYAGIIERWKKRGAKAVSRLDPANLNITRVMDLVRRYGNAAMLARREEVRRDFTHRPQPPEELDDFAACKIQKPEDVRDLFVRPFYFGCEADDVMNAWAFNTQVNPFGARLQAVFGSDIGHWDVPDMREVVAEAYELVEHGLMTEDDFQDFVFGNAITLFGGTNPDFFRGTRVEGAVDKALARTAGTR